MPLLRAARIAATISLALLPAKAFASLYEGYLYYFSYTSGPLDIDRCAYEPVYSMCEEDWGYPSNTYYLNRTIGIDFELEFTTARSTRGESEYLHIYSDHDDGEFEFQLDENNQPASWSGYFYYYSSNDGFGFSSTPWTLSFGDNLQVYLGFRDMIDTRYYSTSPGTLTLNYARYYCEDQGGLGRCDPLPAPVPAAGALMASAFAALGGGALWRRRRAPAG